MRRLLLVLGLLSAVYGAKPGLDTNTIWDIRSVSDPQITKDAKSVIYVLGWSDKMTDQRWTNLWIVSGDGKDERPLTTRRIQGATPSRASPRPTARDSRTCPTAAAKRRSMSDGSIVPRKLKLRILNRLPAIWCGRPTGNGSAMKLACRASRTGIRRCRKSRPARSGRILQLS